MKKIRGSFAALAVMVAAVIAMVCAPAFAAASSAGDAAPGKLVETSIPFTKKEGDGNFFTFSQVGWSEGDADHVWSESPSEVDSPQDIWYEVSFVGSEIDVYAGKNFPMGYVRYSIDGELKGEYSLYNKTNVSSELIATFSGLAEGEHTLRAEATGKRDKGSTDAKIDCSKVVVRHAPYRATKLDVQPRSLDLAVGQTAQVNFTAQPDYVGVGDISFTSENEKIASIDGHGSVHAHSQGKTNVTVEATGVEPVKISVNVSEPVAQITGSIVDTDSQWTQDRYGELRGMNRLNVTLDAWKGDTAIAEIALASVDSPLQNVRVTVSDFLSGDAVISSQNASARFILSTKAYNGPFLGFGSTTRPVPPDTGLSRSESSDIISNKQSVDMGFNKVQPVWFELDVPRDAHPGEYTGTVSVTADGLQKPLKFSVAVRVADALLPELSEFAHTFDVELWQYPYTSAEYYGVKPFSPEHFEALRPVMELYKSVGGHAITTTICEDAWSGQTYSANDVHYPSMVKWTKEADGSFSYDYSDFDAWVRFNKELGIGDKIVLYSVAPWHGSFTYWEGGKLKHEKFKPGSDRYKQVWSDFLNNLVAHLTDMGWFDDAYVGIDERGFSSAAFDLIDSVHDIHGKTLKTAGAMADIVGKHDLAMRVDDLNVGDDVVASHPEEFKRLLEERRAAGLRTTLYSCTEHQPGNFSLSAPVESYWSIVNAGKQGTAGFLRWAYDAWVKDPLRDATHNAFEPGDCFLVYPGERDAPDAQPSVRLARMAEGVRDVNKISKMVSEVSELDTVAHNLYDLLTIKPVISRSYLSAEKRSQLAVEVGRFKDGLTKMTERYIKLKGEGSSTVERIEIAGGDQSVSLGQSSRLTALVYPENVLNKRVSWSSSNEEVASISADGTASAHRTGSCRITATSEADNRVSATIVLTVTPSAVDPAARVSKYSFDKDDASDAWGSRNGLVKGATFAKGKVGHALVAKDGQCVELPHQDKIGPNDPWTVSYWVKSTGKLTDRSAVIMDSTGDYAACLKMAANRDSGFRVGPKDGDVLTFAYDFKPDTWYHVAWTQSKQDGLRMYVNGSMVGSANAWTKTNKILAPIDVIGGTGFDGLIDEVKIYNRVLTPSEIVSDTLLPGLNLAETSKRLYAGDTYRIVWNLVSDQQDKTVTFLSSDPAVASVDENGLVTAHAKGKATITVENAAGGYKDEVVITVEKKVPISSDVAQYLLDQDKYVTDVFKPSDESISAGKDLYYGQPDMVQTKTGRLITAFPKGHGKGPIVMMVSDDLGKTWTQKKDIPASWAGSQETPTMYTLNMPDGGERIMLITACPGWGADADGNRYGWNTSYSDDNGQTWTEYRHWHSKRPDGANNDAIVGMASLIQLKDEQGNDIPKWMGVYHSYGYVNYKTYLTFDKDGNEQWSDPVPLLAEHRDIESAYQMCEIGMFRSPDGSRIVGLARSQSHNNPATLIYSDDEGQTWSKPMDLPGSLAGERHKAHYDPVSGRLVITFREIKYDLNADGQFGGNDDWTCGEWVAWVGSYDQLMNQENGDYKITLCEDWANNAKSGDTGYAGFVVLDDGTLIMDSYGHWDKEFSQSWPGGVKTDLCYIKQAKFKLGNVESDNGLVDYSSLEDAIARASSLDRSKYTPESLSALDAVVASAKDSLAIKDLQQMQVADLADGIDAAIAGLVEKAPEPGPNPAPNPNPDPRPDPEPHPKPIPDSGFGARPNKDAGEAKGVQGYLAATGDPGLLGVVLPALAGAGLAIGGFRARRRH